MLRHPIAVDLVLITWILCCSSVGAFAPYSQLWCSPTCMLGGRAGLMGCARTEARYCDTEAFSDQCCNLLFFIMIIQCRVYDIFKPRLPTDMFASGQAS